MARTEYAALRARVMALPNLSKHSMTQLVSGPKVFKDSKDNKNKHNPFLLTEEEMRQAAIRAGIGSEGKEHKIAPSKDNLGEGVIDDDMPDEAEWEAMGDQKTI